MQRFECSAIIFDLDGVLVDSAGLVEQQWRRWAGARGLRAEPFLRVCHGRRAVETIRLAAPHLDAEAEVAALASGDGPNETVGPLDGARRLVESLPSGSWGVATSGHRASAVARLRRAGLPVPPVLVCAEDVQHGKPNPEVYLLAAGLLQVPAAECLVVEDAPAGLQAARAAGMITVGVTTTRRAAALQADAVSPSLQGVYLGRIDRTARGRRLEILVVEP